MNKKIFSSLTILFLLNGCAAPQYKTTYETKKVGTDKYIETTNIVSSLRTVSMFSSGVLTFDSYQTGYEIEYEGPKMQETLKERRPADPLGAMVNTAATIGLNLLLAPKQTGSQAIGDTRSEYVTRTFIDKTKATATGKAGWNTKSVIFTGSILIYGIKNQPIDLYITKNNVDISSYLKESSYASPLKIKVVCKYCEDLKQEQNSNFSSFTREKDIVFDLNSFNALQEEIKEKNAQIDAQIKAKSTSNSATQRCLSIGLREGSQDFIKCIKTLTN
jgi:hypothetical protein